MSNINDFVIKDGVLNRYKGKDAEVVIPEGVTSIGEGAFRCHGLTTITIPESLTSIGEEAFRWCNELTSVLIPESVTSIGKYAFSGCEKLADESGLVIINGILFDSFGEKESVIIPEGVIAIGNSVFSDCSKLTSVTIPESVASIGDFAFSGCSGLTSVTIPKGTTSIGKEVFRWCSGLTSVIISESVTNIGKGTFLCCKNIITFEMNNCKAKLAGDVFGNQIPKGLIPKIPTLYINMADGALKKYVLEKETWNCLSRDVQAEIFLARQGKSLETAYMQCIDSKQLEPIGNIILEHINSTKSTAKECNAAAAYMTMFYDKAPAAILNQLYAKLKECKNSTNALKRIEEQKSQMEKFGSEVKADDSLSPVSQKVITLMIAEKRNAKDVEKSLKDYYGLTFKNLPEIKDAEGKSTEPYVLAWLLMAHETMESYQRTTEVFAGYEKSGLCPEAAEIVAMLDQKSLQAALLQLADEHLGAKRLNKKVFLAFPVCRYADEVLMEELTKRAPKWRSSISGDDALPLDPFREAVWYSDTRAAMFFAERYHDMKEYAAVRGMDEDTIRDKYLSDVGLDEQGGKEYDLGNQVVIARLQDDMSFLVELPSGKTAKFLPKKGSNPEKYEAAKKDFDGIKKNAKKILKNRGKVLFEDFLSGKARSSEDWQNSYLHNPLLRKAASLVVWSQGKNTFTLKGGTPVNSSEQSYTITADDIKVAHPMEMNNTEVKAWQIYFTSNGLKQPFAQVWEPVRKSEEIKEDRYKGCMIPYYRFKGQEKHGIWIQDEDYHNEIIIGFEGCSTVAERIDYRRHDIQPDDRFEVASFKFKEYNRQINHIVAYLDRVTVWDRVRKDDLSVVDMIDGFTLAQITDFIAAAQEANAHNVLAALLEYKNNNFADFDPMDEFTLEW